MPWAARRRLIILLIVGAVVVALLTAALVTTLHRAPSCTDGVQNQGEAGIDCGGSCAYLCTALLQPPTVLFTKTVSNGAGRTDIVAAVENKNTSAAAKHVPYRIQLYGKNRALIREISGTLDLPPGTNVPVFFPGIPSEKQAVTNAFLTVDSPSLKWFTLVVDPRIVPTVSNTRQGGMPDAPRIEAVLVNSSATTLTDVSVIVLVRDVQGSVIAASKTIVPLIPAQGRATAAFTWDGAFSGTPASIEVVPIIPLPDRQAGLP